MKVIMTGPDFLIELVNKEGKIPIPVAAKKLNVNRAQITAWAEVLTRKGVVGIYYPLAGDGVLTKGGVKLTGAENTVKETKTSDDLILLMKEHTFLKFDKAVNKLVIEPDTLKKWVKELEEEDVIESETYFFGDIGLMKSNNFLNKLEEIEGKKKG
ncbi:hypothetical protein BEH94_10950 [Candidatus Altiarchaeales archaeon WOR_SM1_SCG]|nr:hypothetical protein BEH94_10950 [Candidatus Altiarchaeales archaeon WOR_SM1_SCG]